MVMRHMFHFDGVSKIDAVAKGNEHFLGFMAKPKELMFKGNQVNMIGFLSNSQKKRMADTGLPKVEDIIRKIVNKYLVNAEFFREVPWNKNVYTASKTISDSIKINLSTGQMSSSFKITDIGLTENEKQLMFSKTGAELYNKQYELNKDKNYFSPINENINEMEMLAGITDEILEGMDEAQYNF